MIVSSSETAPCIAFPEESYPPASFEAARRAAFFERVPNCRIREARVERRFSAVSSHRKRIDWVAPGGPVDVRAPRAYDSEFAHRNCRLEAKRLSVNVGRVSTMEKKKLEAFKKRLEDRQRELRYTVNRTAQDGRDADLESAQDIADRAANSYNKEFLFSQSNNERQLLQMVDAALSRIREGTFGECISCGEEINAKRLDAVPWTRHCIACQEKLESGLLEHSST